MGELIIYILIFIGGFTSILVCKYLMYRFDNYGIENNVFIEESIDDEVPPKYEDIT